MIDARGVGNAHSRPQMGGTGAIRCVPWVPKGLEMRCDVEDFLAFPGSRDILAKLLRLVAEAVACEVVDRKHVGTDRQSGVKNGRFRPTIHDRGYASSILLESSP